MFFIADQANHNNNKASPRRLCRPGTHGTPFRVCVTQYAPAYRVTYCNLYKCKKCSVFFIAAQANHNNDETSPRRQRRPSTQGTLFCVCVIQYASANRVTYCNLYKRRNNTKKTTQARYTWGLHFALALHNTQPF